MGVGGRALRCEGGGGRYVCRQGKRCHPALAHNEFTGNANNTLCVRQHQVTEPLSLPPRDTNKHKGSLMPRPELAGDLARVKSQEMDESWPSLIEVTAYWSKDGSRKGRRRS